MYLIRSIFGKKPTDEEKNRRPKSQYNYENRAKWETKTEFILSLLGYAVGIGNVWRFPYLCYRSGGGAFLIPYVLWLFLCGIPTFFLELCIGQFSSTGCTGIFRLMPMFKGASAAMIIINLLTACYYSVILTYPIRYMVTLLYSKYIPWDSCDNPWNTPQCIALKNINKNQVIGNLITPANEYFHHSILQVSSGINNLGRIVWPIYGCIVFTWIVIYLCISRGINTVGKVVYFTATFPYVILFVLLIRGVTLDGAVTGVIYYINPDWSKLTDLKIWADAAIQIFFSMGPGWGGIVNMASFNDFRNNAEIDAFTIPIINVCTSILAGFVVFSVIGFLSYKSGIPIAQVAVDGPSLAFITYPEAISLLPLPRFWGVMFFFMLFLLGLDSVFVQIEAVATSIIDEYPKLRKYKVWLTVVICIILLISTLAMATQGGIYIISLLDWYTASITVIFICLLELYMVSWNYGINKFLRDMEFMFGKKISKIWKYLWKYVTLLVMLFIFITSIAFNRRITYNRQPYPDYAVAIGWCICASSLICIPLYILYIFIFKKGTCKEKCIRYSRVTDWAPADSATADEYFDFIAQYDEAERVKKENKKKDKVQANF